MLDLMMFLITAGAATTLTAWGYISTRNWVSRRLRYVDAVQTPIAPVLAGVAATAVALPLAAIVPLVGGGTAILFGIGVGAGTRAGVGQIRRGLPSGA